MASTLVTLASRGLTSRRKTPGARSGGQAPDPTAGGDGANRILLIYQDDEYALVVAMAEQAMDELGAPDMSRLFRKLLEERRAGP